MGRELTEQLHEAEQLLQKVDSWSEGEIQELPRFYREKAMEIQEQFSEG